MCWRSFGFEPGGLEHKLRCPVLDVGFPILRHNPSPVDPKTDYHYKPLSTFHRKCTNDVIRINIVLLSGIDGIVWGFIIQGKRYFYM